MLPLLNTFVENNWLSSLKSERERDSLKRGNNSFFQFIGLSRVHWWYIMLHKMTYLYMHVQIILTQVYVHV